MSDIKAHSMARFWHVVGVDGARLTGTFIVMASPRRSGEFLVYPHDVTVWDEARNGGRILYRNDFTAWVRDGDVDVPKHMVNGDKLAELEEVWNIFIEVIRAVATIAAQHIPVDEQAIEKGNQ